MSHTLSQKVFSGLIYQYFARIIAAIFSFITIVYIIRKLSIKGYGLYNFLLSVVLLAQIITSFGLVSIIQRYLPEYDEKKNKYIQRTILSSAVCIRFVAGLFFVLALRLASKWIMDVFDLPDTFTVILPLVSLLILIVLETQLLGDAALVSLFENKYWGISRSLYCVLKFSLFFLALKLRYGILGVVWAWLIVEMVLFILCLIKVLALCFPLPVIREEIHVLPLRRFLRFGLPLWFRNVLYLFRDKASDVFILSYFLGQEEVGLYSFAFGIPLFIISFSPGNILRSVITPALVRKYVRDNNKEDLIYFFQFMNRITFFTVVPISLALIIFSKEIIKYVFNPAYFEVSYLFILSVGFLMMIQFQYSYISILHALEKPKIMLMSSWAAVYNLIMDLILIPKLGILGAILATGSAGVILLPYYHITINKVVRINLEYPWKSFMKFSLNIVPICLILLFLKSFVNGIVSLIGVLLIGSILYLCLSYLNIGFEAKDQELINHTIGRNT